VNQTYALFAIIELAQDIRFQLQDAAILDVFGLDLK
jgi:hypothetical protein